MTISNWDTERVIPTNDRVSFSFIWTSFRLDADNRDEDACLICMSHDEIELFFQIEENLQLLVCKVKKKIL